MSPQFVERIGKRLVVDKSYRILRPTHPLYPEEQAFAARLKNLGHNPWYEQIEFSVTSRLRGPVALQKRRTHSDEILVFRDTIRPDFVLPLERQLIIPADGETPIWQRPGLAEDLPVGSLLIEIKQFLSHGLVRSLLEVVHAFPEHRLQMMLIELGTKPNRPFRQIFTTCQPQFTSRFLYVLGYDDYADWQITYLPHPVPSARIYPIAA